MTIRAVDVDMHVLNMRTRMPFKYGIATLTALPHLFVRVELSVNGIRRHGLASDGLPPKWFTKDPATHFREDLDDMLHVIRSAGLSVREVGSAATVFELWRRLHERQAHHFRGEPGVPPLLWGLGVSLIERAMIDAFCRVTATSFSELLRSNVFGVRLEEMHPAELGDSEPGDWLPAQPRTDVIARHTVGLADPLTDGEIPTDEKLDDGLPQSLEACIAAYGLTHFKIKLCGDVTRDIDRLTTLQRVITAGCGEHFAFTLDGNEQYRDVEPFRDLWQRLSDEPTIAAFLEKLIFVEQPLHRDVALGDGVGEALRAWRDRPAIIIDESDGALGDARRAMQLGCAGTSHKNCKGVFKGVANACLIARRRREGDAACVMSGEDLANVGPVALHEDLNVAANLGIESVERNGHHYFRGLDMLPDDVQRAAVETHGDLYRRHDRGFSAVRIEAGRMKVASVVAGPLGPAFELDTTRFTPLDEWRYESLE